MKEVGVIWRLSSILLVLAFAFSQLIAFAADGTCLLSRVETVIQTKEPQWELKRKRTTRQNRYTLYEWGSGKSSAGALIFIFDSRERAKEALSGLTQTLEINGLKMEVTGTVPNLGDENYEWRDIDHDGMVGVDFRRGSVVVHVTASSLEIARQFASHIAGEISAN